MGIEIKDNTLIISEEITEINEKYLTNIDKSKITKIVLPNTLEAIRHGTFMYFTNLKEINFPPSLKSIGVDAFNKCESLEHVELNEGLEKVEEGVFDYCNLESLNIPSTVIEMHACAGHDPNFKEITVSKNNEFYSDCNCNIIYDKRAKAVIQACNTSIIPKEAEVIGEGCFYGVNIKQIMIPENIKFIEQIAFNGMRATDIIIKCSTDSLRDDLFENCLNLQNIYIVNDKNKDPYFYEKYDYMIKSLTLDDLLEEGKSLKEINKLLKLKNIEEYTER